MKKFIPHNRAPLVMQKHHNKTVMHLRGFSLIEMLMALLVASLLMAALAPVMIKKAKDNVSLTGEVNAPKLKKHEINYNDSNCNIINSANNTCEGAFAIPSGYNGKLYVTLQGSGGGGGTANTTGSTEYKAAGTYSFVVPAGVDELEVTLVGGGAGGGAGNHLSTTKEFKIIGDNTWTVPDEIKGKNVIVNMCGGGGSGGGAAASSCWAGGVVYQGTGGGGSGGVYQNKVVTMASVASTNVFVGGGGNQSSGSAPGNAAPGAGQWIGSETFFSPVTPAVVNSGAAGDSGGGGAGGILRSQSAQITGGNGGAGGALNGGGGGAWYGHCGTVGAGGGGGGASRFGASGNSHYLYVGGGGGGGGESVSEAYGFGSRYAGTGGGGGGGTGLGGAGGSTQTLDWGCISTGGGGGLPGGNTGGASGCNNRNPASAGAGGNSPLATYSTYCGGAVGAGDTSRTRVFGPDWLWSADPVKGGSQGIVAVTYLTFSNGGSGGGSAAIVPMQKVKVTPGETLTVVVADGGFGGQPAEINASASIKLATVASHGLESRLYRGGTAGTLLLETNNGASYAAQGGAITGQIRSNDGVNTGMPGWITVGIRGAMATISPTGFTRDFGHTAGDSSSTADYGNKTFDSSAPRGGAGGTPKIFDNIYCTAGAGGVAGDSTQRTGKDATGYGGCGGGGGYGLAPGGKGAQGYARITWNPSKVGTGAGGGSGNFLPKKDVEVTSGSIVKYQIGKGGVGGYVSGATIVNGAKGADTIFGIGTGQTAYGVLAGGGYGGNSVTLTGTFPNTTVSNGIFGKRADICKLGVLNLLICADSNNGESGTNDRGGKGASSKYGDGADGVTSGTPNDATNAGSGGGGGGIVNNGLSTSNPPVNATKGSQGAPGKIILEWYE